MPAEPAPVITPEDIQRKLDEISGALRSRVIGRPGRVVIIAAGALVLAAGIGYWLGHRGREEAV